MQAVGSSPAKPVTVQAARERLLETVGQETPIELPLQEAVGCVLAVDVRAEADVPPFSLAAADGFAVRASDVYAASEQAPAILTIVGRALPGQPPEGTVGWGEAVRVGAGVPVPAGADCIVPLPHAAVDGETVRVLASFSPGDSVRPAGQEIRAGQTLIPAGRKLAAPEMALLAATGRLSVPVYAKPRVVVVATEDGRVESGRAAAIGQVRDATSLTLFAALKEVGAVPYLGGIVRDDAEAVKEEVVSHLATADCFIAAGRAALDRDGLQIAFFRRGDIDRVPISMEPDSPVAFGAVEGTPFFGLPSDPADVLVAFELFVRPALLRMMGRRDLVRPEVKAALARDVSTLPDRARYLPARVWKEAGAWRAAAGDRPASARLATLAASNALAVVPPGRGRIRAGSEIAVQVFRPLER